jgi:hypothetical protein
MNVYSEGTFNIKLFWSPQVNNAYGSDVPFNSALLNGQQFQPKGRETKLHTLEIRIENNHARNDKKTV